MEKHGKYRSLVGAAALGLAALLGGQAPAQTACRQALVLGLDISGSVDRAEYRLQLEGLAAALRHPEVVDAFLAIPSAPVHLAVFEWSGPDVQLMIQPWHSVHDAAGIERIAARLIAHDRPPADPSTAIGSAMEFGLRLLAQKPECWKRTLDISGDGKHNTGPNPRDRRPLADAVNAVINGLVIGADAPTAGDARYVELSELVAYYTANVIVGADAFVEAAVGFEDYEAAMVRKLLKELEGLSLSRLSR